MEIIQNGISFNNIIERTAVGVPAVWTNSNNVDLATGTYKGPNINKPLKPIIMGLDIDWNGADLSDILGSEYSSIQTTGQLLSAIKAAAQIVGPQGPQGEQGPQGPQGEPGVTPASSEENHYTPSQEVTTYKQENKVIESITVDSKGHIVGVTFAPKVETIETT